jgi:dihydroorotase
VSVIATIRCPDDFHVHLREDGALPTTVAASARTFARILAMPNTVPPIVTADDAQRYADAIAGAAAGQLPMRPLLTVRAGADVCPETAEDLVHAGVVAAKLYPRGATTNSADGVEDISALYPLLEALQDAELVLCIHAEDPAAPVLERESAYLPTVARLAADFPRLRIVVEHLSTREAVDALATLDRKSVV